MQDAFNHISVLVVVLNAIGLGNLMIGIATYLNKPATQKVIPSSVLIAWLVLHLYLHVMLWWRFFGFRLIETFNFFDYLFMLFGPMCLLFGSALLLPTAEDDGTIDMRSHLNRVYVRLFGFETAFWLWALLTGPIISGAWAPNWYLWAIMVPISLSLALVKSDLLRIALTGMAYVVQFLFIMTEALLSAGFLRVEYMTSSIRILLFSKNGSVVHEPNFRHFCGRIRIM